jgi:hypothetical protein
MNAYNPVNRVAEYTQEGRELVEEYPVATVALVFGLGVMTGIAAVSLLCDSPQQSSKHSTMAHRLGEQLLDAMSSVLPETVNSVLRKH